MSVLGGAGDTGSQELIDRIFSVDSTSEPVESSSGQHRLEFVFGHLVGCTCDVYLTEMAVWRGVCSSISPTNVILRVAYAIPADGSSKIQKHPEKSFSMEEVLHINASAVELSATLPHRPGGGKPSGKFCTDTEISGGILGGNRDLQAWSGPEHSELNLSLDELDSSAGRGGAGRKRQGGKGKMESSSTSWNQFETNRNLFGVETSYDISRYTTKLDTNSEFYKSKKDFAENMARDIEMSKRGSRNAHILEERSGELSGSLDEELRYSSVANNVTGKPKNRRGGNGSTGRGEGVDRRKMQSPVTPPAATGTSSNYVPPHRRKDGADGSNSTPGGSPADQTPASKNVMSPIPEQLTTTRSRRNSVLSMGSNSSAGNSPFSREDRIKQKEAFGNNLSGKLSPHDSTVLSATVTSLALEPALKRVPEEVWEKLQGYHVAIHDSHDSSGKSASASLAMPAAVPSSQAACHSGTPPKSPPTHARSPQQQSEAFLARQRVPGSRQKATEELKQFKEKFDKELSKSPLQSDPFKKGASGNASSSSSATTSSPPPSTATASDQSNAGGEGKGAVPEKPKFKLDLNAEAFIPQSRASGQSSRNASFGPASGQGMPSLPPPTGPPPPPGFPPPQMMGGRPPPIPGMYLSPPHMYASAPPFQYAPQPMMAPGGGMPPGGYMSYAPQQSQQTFYPQQGMMPNHLPPQFHPPQ